ncbi:hypothetical protein GCK32_000502 [Trichostrongylus colubriformis]|uniref:Phosphatidylinositol-4,5-bisphosphate 4-phosphatase n=1 Tax=Trichostrongylus colubriformis TaxID=6319 RepID=A0AAN8F835_TRICO
MDEEQRKKKLGNLIVNIFGEDIDEDAEGGHDDDDEQDEKQQEEVNQEDEDDYVQDRNKDDGRDRAGFEWDFDLMLREKKAERKKKRKRRDAGIDIINDDDGVIAHMVNAMKNAAKDDRHSNTERKPALKKRKMLHDVKMMLLRMDMLEAMIDGGMMSAVSEWLAPLPDKSLPALEIRTELLKILSGFGNLDQGVLKQSGLGRAVMLLYKHPRETKENKAMAAQIIREWSRPIFQLDTDFRSVSREERLQRDLEHMSHVKKRRMRKQHYRMDREGSGNENASLLRDDQRGQSYLGGGGDDLEATHRGIVENVDDANGRHSTGATVTCRVCEEQIELGDRDNRYVVKCGVCQEATPIRPAPAGKKYVRCPCNCLLICGAACIRTACPRGNCRRVITLVNLDFPHLTLHEAKKEEIESQVRILELEQQLVMERKKLVYLRKRIYHMTQLAVAEHNGANGERDSSCPFELLPMLSHVQRQLY